VLWLDEPDLGAGPTSRGAALRLKEGIHWSGSGIVSKTCGASCGLEFWVSFTGMTLKNWFKLPCCQVESLTCIRSLMPASIAGAYACETGS